MTPAPPPNELLAWFAKFLAAAKTDPDPDRLMTEDELRIFNDVRRWVAEDPQAPAELRRIIRTLPEEFYRRDLSAAELAEPLGISEGYIRALAELGLLRGHLGPAGCWSFSLADAYPVVFPDEGDQA